MFKQETIRDMFNTGHMDRTVTVRGWVRTRRGNAFVSFVNVNDGSTINNMQCVFDLSRFSEEQLRGIDTGAAVSIVGQLVASQGAGQSVEVQATDFTLHGAADPETYPIQPKKHSLEFLREKGHLRVRTSTFSAVYRIRHTLTFAIHDYFNRHGFYNVHSPIITGSDAEGAGEMFRVTTLPAINPPLRKSELNKNIDYSKFDELSDKYFQAIVNYIKSNRSKNLKVDDFTVLKEVLNSDRDFIKNLILCKPSDLDRISHLLDNLRNSSDEKNIELTKVIDHVGKSMRNIVKYMRDGRLKDLNKRTLTSKIRGICHENGWSLVNKAGETTRLKYSFKKHPILCASFYNIFEISETNKVDFTQDFFGKETNLTVSGQLEAELAALALGKVYTFGPTFRAENSNTSRHLAEFWMIEPEVAFTDINGNMDLAEDFLKNVIRYVMEHCHDDLKFLSQRLADEEKSKPQDQRSPMELIEKLRFVVENDFERLTYTEAVKILRDSKPNQKKQFEYPVNDWGIDLQSEHERYLVEKHFKKPVILTGYPAKIKAFYMRLNEGCEPGRETVAAMDILFPGIGEIVGGSQREERYDVLLDKVKQFHIPEESVWWYLETRKFGTVPHAGFGLGFERLMMFLTGMGNVRDVIPFPRTPKNCDF